MLHRASVYEPAGQPSYGLSRLGGLCALSVAIVLVGSLLSFFVALPGLGLGNWLVVLFDLNAGIGGLPVDPLRVLNPIDLAVLVLVGVAFLGLGPALGHRIWIGIASALPFAGIVILLITHLAGRSAVMAAGLVIGFVMLASRTWKPLAYIGILANLFLLTGDFATTGSRVPVVAALVGVGYVLLIAWFLMIGMSLLELGRSRQGAQAGGPPKGSVAG